MGYISIKSKNLVYLNMPKSGCTSIKNHLYYVEKGSWLSDPLKIHKQRKGLLKSKFENEKIIIEDKMKGSFVFTFVREPGARIYSLYSEKIRSKGKYSFPRVTKCLIDEYGFKLMGKSIEIERSNFYSFLSFIQDNIDHKTDFRLDPHWLPQSIIIRRNTKKRMLDFVGKIENFEQDISFIFNKLGVTEHDFSKRMNINQKKIFQFDQIITDDIQALINKIYQDDYSSFGY